MRRNSRSQRDQPFRSSAAAPGPDVKALSSFFSKYKDPSADVISANGIEALCDDIGISPLDPVTLAIAYHCRAERMGVFTEEEFARGMFTLGCTDAKGLQAKIAALRAALVDKRACKAIYQHAFQFTLEPGQRCLPVEVCVELWKLLLPSHFALLDEWIQFVESAAKGAISRDTWMMVYELATAVRPDLSNYEDDSSWPVLLDEFVEHVRHSIVDVKMAGS